MKIENPTNGFVRVETSRYVILCDPWLSKGIFQGSWVPYPPIADENAPLEGATHCFISHIHEDHYDVETLERLDRGTMMLVPDLYPNQLIAAKLRSMGFGSITMLPARSEVEVSPGLILEVVPRMNAFGQELGQYDQSDRDSLVIDSGVRISADGLKIVLLADNVPYCPSDAGASLDRMVDADLLAFSYNGAASDYPLCYENLGEIEQEAIASERESNRENVNLHFIETVRPKALLPYSSEFALQGPMAVPFARWCGNEWWANKHAAVTRYRATTGLPAFGLYEKDVLEVHSSGCELRRSSFEPPPLKEFAESLSSPVPNTRNLYPAVALSEAECLIEQSAAHMFEKMDQYGLATEWCFGLSLYDAGWTDLYVDLRRRELSRREPPGRPLLVCMCEANYLAALLRGECHWNNAMISFNLKWRRKPNLFHRPLYDALNYFHRPRSSSPAPRRAEAAED